MSGFLGRSVQLDWGGTALGGVRTKGLELNGEPVDVTSDEDGGWRVLLTEPGENQVNITVSGVTKSDVLKTDWFTGNRTRAVALDYPDGGTVSGTFYLATYTETGNYNDAVTFDATLQSSGPVSYDPAS